jgi:hypothetical protein
MPIAGNACVSCAASSWRRGRPREASSKRAGKRVLFTQTIDMVQRLQIARRDLSLVGALEKFDNAGTLD